MLLPVLYRNSAQADIQQEAKPNAIITLRPSALFYI